MCTYNGDRFLREQLESIAAQSELPRRLAIVDDGSSDGTWELLQQWSRQAPFEVRLLRNEEKLGVVKNFERSIELVGDDVDIVFLADQDDRWFPEKLALFADRFATDPQLGLLHSDAELIDGQGALRGRRLFETLLVTQGELASVRQGEAWRVYVKRNLVTGAACAVRRSVLIKALPFSPDWIHDEWLAFIASLVSSVSVMEAPTMAYRLHASNTVGMPIPTLGWRLRTTFHALSRSNASAQLQRAVRLHHVLTQAKRLHVSSEICQYLGSAIAHAEFRGNLPRNFLLRWQGIWHSWRAKDYERWSNGDISALHDLLALR
jgi:Predicted glycosyltransferases